MSVHASQSEIMEALEGLSDSDLLALRKSAAWRIEGTQYGEPADLLHEALVRLLDGRRQWPRRIPLTLFLSNAMKSIANSDRRLYQTRHVFSVSHLATAEIPDPLSEIGASSLSPEDELEAFQESGTRATMAREALAGFEDDEGVKAVLAGRMEGLTVKQAIEAYGISASAYDAARKRLSRQIANHNQTNSGRLH